MNNVWEILKSPVVSPPPPRRLVSGYGVMIVGQKKLGTRLTNRIFTIVMPGKIVA